MKFKRIKSLANVNGRNTFITSSCSLAIYDGMIKRQIQVETGVQMSPRCTMCTLSYQIIRTSDSEGEKPYDT